MDSLTLPSGRVLVYDPGRHRYEIDGIAVPGTTSLMRRHGLIEDRIDASTRLAMDRGARVHEALEFDATGDLDESGEWAQTSGEMGYVEAARQARRELGLEVASAEQLVGSDRWWYATKVDVSGVRAGRNKTLVNWKTGGAMPHYPVQLHLEALLMDSPPDELLCIRLTRDGTYHVDDVTKATEAAAVALSIASAQGRVMTWRIRHGRTS